MQTIPISLIDVMILCGGQGTRLRKVVDDRPKPMAEISGRPFLDFIIEHVASFGFRRFILCSGYKSMHITDYYINLDDGLTYVISEEKSRLGTAGAVANAKHLTTSKHILVLNGDSYCPANLQHLLDFHFNKNSKTTIVLAKIENPKDFGVITTSQQEIITGFNEKKKKSGPGLVNAGIYLFNSDVINSIPQRYPISLETEFFPTLIKKETVYGFTSHKNLIDIGTPERLKEAKNLLV
jgi:D-glycero-alpha-D-manno-heptose 1-phosphate guanylyltransferase